MSDVYYARPVTVTDERMQEALEKQAKQRALREALDSQIHSRVPTDGGGSSNANLPPKSTSGMTKAQQKRVELMQMQAERQQQQQQQQQQQPVQVHSSTSLPPNFAMSSSFALGGGGPPPRPNGVYDSMSLPAGTLQQHLSGGGGGVESTLSPTSVTGRPFNNPNFNLAEVYAQQQTTHRGGGLHAPTNELPVPLSPRQITNASPHEPVNYPPKGATSGSAYHAKQLTSSDMLRGSTAEWPPPKHQQGGGGGENVQNILRMAQRVTDQPSSMPQQQQYTSNSSDVARGGPTDLKPRLSGTPLHQGTGAQKREKSRERVSESRVEKLQKELQTRQHEMQRMRDKERNWEEQVKQLKTELKNARQKERDLSKLVQEKPQRAETAPNTGSISKLAPLDEPKRNKDTAPERLNRPVNQHQHGAPGAGQPTRKDFNNARVFQNETFRPITAPLEPIDDVVRSSGQQQLPPLPDSLKMASFNTRKIAFGLLQTADPIPMSYQQLCDFVKSQVVTQFQADALWRLFSGEEPPKKPSPPPGSRPRDPSRRTSAIPTSPTYETYEELADEEDEEYYEDDDA